MGPTSGVANSSGLAGSVFEPLDGAAVTSPDEEEHGSGPRRIDIPIILLCAGADMFISGLLTGEPIETTLGTILPPWPVVLAIAAAYSVLAWRRSRPWASFLAILGVSLVLGVLLTSFQPFVGVALALLKVARRSPARQANPALVLAAFVALNSGWTATRISGDDSVFALMSISGIFMALFTLIWVIGRRERRIRARTREEQERLMATAQESLGQQRQQIARDLHDILSHSMSAMILQSAGAKAVSTKLDGTIEAKQVTEALTAIESTGAESMRELHRLLGLLRTAEGPGDPGVARLRLADVDTLITATRHGGLVVQLHREGAVLPLDPSVDLAAYHMVQESLTNAMKHAGRGAVVDIYETWAPDQLQLQVRCSRGLAPEEGDVKHVGSGTGLWGLRERVQLAGGSFESGPVDGGFVTSAVLPVRSGRGTSTETEGDS